MQLSYVVMPGATEQSATTIKVILEEGETLGHLRGPVEASVPMDPANVDYAAIVENGYPIESQQQESSEKAPAKEKRKR
jgi:hypothetical protein